MKEDAPRGGNGNDNDGAGSSKGSGPSAKPLPPWAMEVVRSVVHGISRVAWRIRFCGLENVPTGPGGFIVVANHQTYFDPFWVGIPIRRKLRYLAWDEAFNWPVVGRGLTLLGAWPLQIERGNPTALRRSVQWLREGGTLVVFPEGGRSLSNGELARFKQGACRIALEAGVPILPATIRGGERIWPRGWRFPRLGRVEVVYHPLCELNCEPAEEARDCARRMTEHLFQVVDAGRTR